MKNNLYKIRSERQLTLKQLELLTGVSDSTLNRIENNQTNPTLSTIHKIAKGLKVKINDIIQC